MFSIYILYGLNNNRVFLSTYKVINIDKFVTINNLYKTKDQQNKIILSTEHVEY